MTANDAEVTEEDLQVVRMQASIAAGMIPLYDEKILPQAVMFARKNAEGQGFQSSRAYCIGQALGYMADLMRAGEPTASNLYERMKIGAHISLWFNAAEVFELEEETLEK